jgi:hypothetical protein
MTSNPATANPKSAEPADIPNAWMMRNAVGNQTPIIKTIPRADPTPTWSAVPPGERRMILIPSFDASRIARGPRAPGSHHSLGSAPDESAVGLIQKRKVLPFATLDRIEFTQNAPRPTLSHKGILTPPQGPALFRYREGNLAALVHISFVTTPGRGKDV